MSDPRRLLAALLMLALAVPLGAAAGSDWRVSGSNTLNLQHYRIEGNEAASPYRHEGWHSFNDINLSVVGRQGAHAQWRFQFAGVYNDSAYRAAEQGFLPERISVYHERHDVAVPFRVELGDQLLRLSPLTIDQTVKGMRLELLPQSAVDGRQQSLMVFAGADGTDWLNFDPKGSQFRGASWTWSDNRLGRYGANVVYHTSQNDQVDEQSSQWVGSLMAERSFHFSHQQLVAQGEIAQFVGDSDQDGEEERDHAVTARLSGRDQVRPLSYELSYERYGQDFSPAGVYLQNKDYRGIGARAGVGLAQDYQLQARGHWATFGVDGINPVESDTFGLNLQGPLNVPLLAPIEGMADVMVQTRQSELGNVDNRTTTARVDLRIPTGARGDIRLGLLRSYFDNHAQPNNDRTTRQLSLSRGVGASPGGIDVSARAGVVYRTVDGERPQESLNPTLSLTAANSAHRFGMNLGLRSFQTAPELGPDVDTYLLSAQYQYNQGSHTLGLEFERELRLPDGQEQTDSWRVGAFWRYSFDHGVSG